MPNYKRNEPDSHGNEYKDICYPITADFRKEIESTIIDKYNGINKMNRRLQIAGLALLKKIRLLDLHLSR